MLLPVLVVQLGTEARSAKLTDVPDGAALVQSTMCSANVVSSLHTVDGQFGACKKIFLKLKDLSKTE
jgi:hypothetical protein